VSSLADLLGPTEIRELARRLGVQPAKHLGQNFVVDAGTVSRIAAQAELGPDDVVLEVGPGFGSLTLPLLRAAGRVVAVEIDPVLAAELPRTVAARAPDLASRLTVIQADAARVTELPFAPTALVANLPYNVAVPVVLHLLATFGSLRRGLVMVQAEVADRMAAGPGSRVYGVPSAKLAWYADVRRAGSVPRGVFWPVPRVDSGLVAFTVRPFDPSSSGQPSSDQSAPVPPVDRSPSDQSATPPPPSPASPPPPKPSSAPSPPAPLPTERSDALSASPSPHPSPSPSPSLTERSVEPSASPSPPPSRPLPSPPSSTERSIGSEAGLAGVDREAVFAVIDAAFSQRRKTLRAALAGWAGSPANAEAVLRAAGVDPGLRGEALGIAEFTRIAAATPARPAP
jgi:16S rRNA (adenine1518-N6/adenine1519-N6)-dimethyltransferase